MQATGVPMIREPKRGKARGSARKTRAKRGAAPTGPALPPEATSFVGRARELAAITRLLDSGARLVTLIGPAGVGKTRLVRRYGSAQREGAKARRPVVFVDLAEARSGDDVVAAVARALGVPLTPGSAEDASAQLGRALGARGPLLLLLDNFEQVAAHAPATVRAWLTHAPGSSFLVTSREPLGLAGEARVELAALDLADGVALLEQRAQSVLPGYAPSEAERAALAEIVGTLDGIPLAIELAASRMVVLSASQLLARLHRRFEVLRTNRRDTTLRHSTLERAIDWSWQLLGPVEQSVLMQCSVFRGGFFLDAAEAIVYLGEQQSPPPLLELLQALREKSLLRTSEIEQRPGEVRFGMYESIRDYAVARLDASGSRAGVLGRHACYYAWKAEAWAENASGLASSDAISSLGVELDNLLAVARSPDGPEPLAAARTTLALGPLLWSRGPFETYLGLLELAGGTVGRAGDPGLQIRVLRARGEARRARGQITESRADVVEALALARRAEDRKLEAQVLYTLGQMELEDTQFEEAHRHFLASIALAEAAGDRQTMAKSLAKVGELEEQEPHFERALALLREAGDRRSQVILLGNLGRLKREQGRLPEARDDTEEALVVARQLGDRALVGWLVRGLAMVDHLRGDLEAASAGFEQALAIHREVGNLRFEGVALLYLAIVRFEQGALPDASALLEKRLALAREFANPGIEALALGYLAAVAAASDRVAHAERHLAAARERLRSIKVPGLDASVDLLEGIVDMARARACAAAGDLAGAKVRGSSAVRRLETAHDPAGRDGAVLDPGYARLDIELATRVLERALRTADLLGSDAPIARPRRAGVDLEIGPHGAWFHAEEGSRVDLRGRRPFSRLLVRLTEARLASPGDPVSAADMIAAGWPGERLLPQAGSNRLYNAVAELRRLGLTRALLTRNHGYLLDPMLRVEWAPVSGV